MEILLAKEIYLLVTSSCCNVEGAMQYGDFTWGHSYYIFRFTDFSAKMSVRR